MPDGLTFDSTISVLSEQLSPKCVRGTEVAAIGSHAQDFLHKHTFQPGSHPILPT